MKCFPKPDLFGNGVDSDIGIDVSIDHAERLRDDLKKAGFRPTLRKEVVNADVPLWHLSFKHGADLIALRAFVRSWDR